MVALIAIPVVLTLCLWLLLHWSLLSALAFIRGELTRIEVALIREVKRRAGEARWEEPTDDKDLEGVLEARAGVRSSNLGQRREPWWRKHGVQAGKVPPEGREVGS